MREVEYFTFMLPPDIWRKKGGPSSYKMSIEEAAQRYPGAQPILSSREVKRLPATEDEIRHAMLVPYPQYGKSGLPPGRDNGA